jgi:four helix bundle protein
MSDEGNGLRLVDGLRCRGTIVPMSKKIRRFEDLIAWQKARVLTRTIYRVSSRGAFARDYALRDQIRRAAISVPSNIAEGYERARRREFHHFLCIAKGSCAEVTTQLYIAHDVGYIDEDSLRKLLSAAEEVGRVIGGLRSDVATKLRSSSSLMTHHSSLAASCSSRT